MGQPTPRTALVEGFIKLGDAVLKTLTDGKAPKGKVINTAIVAGIQAEDKPMVISEIRLLEKTGGKPGTFRADPVFSGYSCKTHGSRKHTSKSAVEYTLNQ